MTPVTQEYVHVPELGQHGDCQRAVIASLLDLPLSEVPHFLQEADGDAVKFWDGIQTFLRSKGLAYLTIPAGSGVAFFGSTEEAEIYHEISGPSPRGNGVRHAVVGLNGRVCFDPHPSRAGLVGDPNQWEFCYLVKVCASNTLQSSSLTSPEVPTLSTEDLSTRDKANYLKMPKPACIVTNVGQDRPQHFMLSTDRGVALMEKGVGHFLALFDEEQVQKCIDEDDGDEDEDKTL